MHPSVVPDELDQRRMPDRSGSCCVKSVGSESPSHGFRRRGFSTSGSWRRVFGILCAMSVTVGRYRVSSSSQVRQIHPMTSLGIQGRGGFCG